MPPSKGKALGAFEQGRLALADTDAERRDPVTGAASPQLFQAAVTNEVLKSVLFEFIGTDKAGKEQVFETVKLTNATIADLKRTLDEHTTEGARGIDQVSNLLPSNIQKVSRSRHSPRECKPP